MGTKTRRPDLVEPDLSYTIVGVLYDVHNTLGGGHREAAYQRAVSHAFQKAGLPFKEQALAPLSYKGKRVGSWRLDFLVDGKVAVEIKRREQFTRKDLDQLYDYLRTARLQLGILAHFTKTGIRFKRIVNIQ